MSARIFSSIYRTPCDPSRTLKPVKLAHCQCAYRVASVERRARLEHQNNRLRRKRTGPMLHAPRNDDEVAFVQLLDAFAKIDCDSPAQHEESFVFAFMRVPIELSAEFRHLDLTVVD